MGWTYAAACWLAFLCTPEPGGSLLINRVNQSKTTKKHVCAFFDVNLRQPICHAGKPVLVNPE